MKFDSGIIEYRDGIISFRFHRYEKI